MKSLESEIESLSERLDARKVIDRAKGSLMDNSGLSEQEAWRFLQTEAMNRRSKVHEVAALVISGEIKPAS